MHSIGLCSISTGIYGYPLNEAVKIAADTLHAAKAKSLTDIAFYCYGEREYQAFAKRSDKPITFYSEPCYDRPSNWLEFEHGRGRLGSQQGMQRTIAARQQTAGIKVSAMRSMDDAHLSVALDDIFDQHTRGEQLARCGYAALLQCHRMVG